MFQNEPNNLISKPFMIYTGGVVVFSF